MVKTHNPEEIDIDEDDGNTDDEATVDGKDKNSRYIIVSLKFQG